MKRMSIYTLHIFGVQLVQFLSTRKNIKAARNFDGKFVRVTNITESKSELYEYVSGSVQKYTRIARGNRANIFT